MVLCFHQRFSETFRTIVILPKSLLIPEIHFKEIQCLNAKFKNKVLCFWVTHLFFFFYFCIKWRAQSKNKNLFGEKKLILYSSPAPPFFFFLKWIPILVFSTNKVWRFYFTYPLTITFWMRSKGAFKPSLIYFSLSYINFEKENKYKTQPCLLQLLWMVPAASSEWESCSPLRQHKANTVSPWHSSTDCAHIPKRDSELRMTIFSNPCTVRVMPIKAVFSTSPSQMISNEINTY